MATKRETKPKGATGQLAPYLRAPYVRMIIPNAEEGGYLAEVLELPGCITEGDTLEEAYHNVEDAMAGWIETSLEDNRPIPEPVGDKEYSGHFPLRMSTELHRAAALRAMQEGISLNQWIVGAIAAQVAKENLADQIAAKVVRQISVSAEVSLQIAEFSAGGPAPSDFAEARLRPGTTESTIVSPGPVVLTGGRPLREAAIHALEDGKEVSQNG